MTTFHQNHYLQVYVMSLIYFKNQFITELVRKENESDLYVPFAFRIRATVKTVAVKND